mgnify:CR=1 FL=1
MKRAVLDMGVPLESAVRAATLNPARSIGIDADYAVSTQAATATSCWSMISWIF